MNCKYFQEHVDFLKENIVGASFKELTEMFNKRFGMELKTSSLISLADRHGLHNGRNTAFKTGWEPTQFKKGQIAWNKGKKKSWKGGEETQFKVGHRPHNWVPIGSERITKDGYIQIKIQEGKFQKNWKGKHILIWEEHNGPVPEGHNVIFGDGDRRNFDLNNLILVSKKQMLGLNRNNLIQNDAELTRIGIVIADLNYKVSERRKKSK
jgi:hypothetical protein